MVKSKPTTIKEVGRKEMTVCQNCGRSRLEEGIILSKCAACKIALYCSKDCQKAGWPDHKKTCELNQRTHRRAAELTSQEDAFKALRVFCSKHRPSLAEYGVRALDLALDTTRSLREIILVKVRFVPDAKSPETAYIVTDAEVVPLSVLGERDAELLGSQLKDFDEQQKRMGHLGGLMVMVMDIGRSLKVSNVCPIGFTRDSVKIPPGKPRKEPLMLTLNSGIVY